MATAAYTGQTQQTTTGLVNAMAADASWCPAVQTCVVPSADTVQQLNGTGSVTAWGSLVEIGATPLTSNISITLPAASGSVGKTTTFKRLDSAAFTVTLVPFAGDTGEVTTPTALNSQFGALTVEVSSSTKYEQVSNISAAGVIPATTNTLVAAAAAITSTVDGVMATITPAAGTIQDNLGFNAAGDLVKSAPAATTNLLASSAAAITSTVDGVAATLTPAVGVIQDALGFNAAGALIKAVPTSSGILIVDGTQTANRVQNLGTFSQTWNNVGGFTKNIVTGSEVANFSDTFTPITAQVSTSPSGHSFTAATGMGTSGTATVNPSEVSIEIDAGGTNKASLEIGTGTVGAANTKPQTFVKTSAVNAGTAVAGQVYTLSAATGEAEFVTAPASVDTIQTANVSGTTTVTAWGSVVLVPTLIGNITILYPTPVGSIGKTIKVVQAGVPNAFTITHTPAVGTLTFTNAAGELAQANGAITLEVVDASSARQVSNSATAVAATTNTLVAAAAAITSTVDGVVATITPAVGTLQDKLGFNAAGDLVKAVSAPTNTLVAAAAAITSTVDGVAAVLTPASGTIQDKIGFNAAGDLVKSVDRDRRNGTTLRGDSVTGVEPTALEHAGPVSGDTRTVVLSNNTVEYWSYAGIAWTLTATVLPVTIDGNHVPVVRADAVTGVAPTVGEVPSPVSGDSASVYLTDGTVEHWYFTAAWALIKTVSPLSGDGNTSWVVRGDAVTGNFPTGVEVPTPINGDSAVVFLTDGKKEYWVYVASAWALTTTDSPAGVTALSQVQVEDSASVVEGTVTGQRLAQAVAANEVGIEYAYPAEIDRVAETGHPVTAKDIANRRIFQQQVDNTLWTPIGAPGTVTWVQIGGAPTADTIQTAAATGGTTITAWGSIVLIPTLTGNITLTYPTPVGSLGKTIKVVQAGVPNAFTITHTPAVGAITFTNAAGELAKAGGAIAVEAITGTSIRQVSNSVAEATIQTLGVYSLTRLRNVIGQQLFTTTSEVPINLSTSTLNVNTGVFSPSLAAGQITVGTAGNYHITFTAQVDDVGGTASALQAYLRVDGVAKGNSSHTATDTYEINTVINTVLALPAGAVITLTALTSDGEDMNLTGYDLSIVQLPSAVAPIVSTVAEYGSSTLVAVNSDANSSAGNWVDHNGLTINLPSAGTYRVFWRVSGEMADAGTTEVVMSGRIRNTTNSTIYDSSRAVIVGYDSPTATLSSRMGTGSGEAIVTATATNTITFQTRMSALASSSAVILGDGNLRATSYLSYEKIAGQLPSTGATVDYVQVKLNGNNVSPAAGGAIVFDTVVTGNIPYSAGVFNLSAGKTYKLTGIAVGATINPFQWRDITNNVFIGARGSAIAVDTGTSTSGNVVAEAIYTAVSDVTVRLESVNATTYFGLAATNAGQTQATITQLSSTNSLGGSTSVNDQAAAGYFDVGNMRMQWGNHDDLNADTSTVTLPAPFANTAYTVTCTSNNGIAGSTSAEAKTTTTFDIDRASTTVTANTWGWIAIGLKA